MAMNLNRLSLLERQFCGHINVLLIVVR